MSRSLPHHAVPESHNTGQHLAGIRSFQSIVGRTDD
jgi:hypothetical protein